MTRKRPIRAEHITAGGALPPGFPAVGIDGERYWDGGIVSNMPLAYVLEQVPRRSRLAFQVDVFQADGLVPTMLEEVAERKKGHPLCQSRPDEHRHAADRRGHFCGRRARQILCRDGHQRPHLAPLDERLKKACTSRSMVLHAGNCSPMKGSTRKVRLEKPGIIACCSRLPVSNDNPFSEALFRTCEDRPDWPIKGFPTKTDAQAWLAAPTCNAAHPCKVCRHYRKVQFLASFFSQRQTLQTGNGRQHQPR